MKVKTYPVLSRAVEEGVAYGWTRAHKHTDNPSEDSVKDAIADAVMSSIGEFFTFDEDETES